MGCTEGKSIRSPLRQQNPQVRVGIYTSGFTRHEILDRTWYKSEYWGHKINEPYDQVIIQRFNVLNESQVKKFKQEVQNMFIASSQGTQIIFTLNFVNGITQKANFYAIVSEKMDGNLRLFLKEKGKVNQKQAIVWICKVAQWYRDNYYKNAAIHGSLIPENIFYRLNKNQLIVKISPQINQKSSVNVQSDCSFYISPQQIQQNSQYTYKADVYALGCIFFQLLNGCFQVPCLMGCVDIKNGFTINYGEIQRILKSRRTSNDAIDFIKGCLAIEQKDRYSWENIFSHQLFCYYKQQQAEEFKQIDKLIRRFPISVDTQTHSWKQQKLYRIDTSHKKELVCEIQSLGWLCSKEDLPSFDSFVFMIRVKKAFIGRKIRIGVMESKYKCNNFDTTLYYAIYLSIFTQRIAKTNKYQTNRQFIQLPSLPCLFDLPRLIQCHVNRQQNTIAWHYNGKQQAKSEMHYSWKQQRKPLCAVFGIQQKGDCIEFI